MKKKKFKLLSIMIIALLVIPQNAIATIPNNTVTFDTNGKTIYYLDKNGVRQVFTEDSQGSITPGSIYSTENTDFDLHLYSPTSTSLTDTSEILVSSEQKNTSNEKISYTTTKTGTYYEDVYAYDDIGSYTLSKASELTYDDTSASLKYVGTWSKDVNASNEGGTAKVINGSGSVSLSFTGSSVKWTGFKDPKQGIARVVIDGATQAEVDLYSPSLLSKQLLFEKSLNFGKHVMEIQWAGIPNKNGKPKKKDPYINIDTIKINTSSPKANAPTITSTTGYASNISLTFKNNDKSADKLYIYKSTAGSNFKLVSTYDSIHSEDQEFWFEDTEVLNDVIYNYYVTAVNAMGESVPSNTVAASKLTTNSVYNAENTNSNMEYTGTWNLENDSTYSGGTRHVTVEAGAKISIPFNALESRIKLMSGPDMGIARIYWSNASGDYYDVNLNAPSVDYLTFGTSSNMGIEGNWVIECVSGKVAFDVENIWNYTNVAPKSPVNLKGILENTVISLNWDTNIELDLKGYNVYRSSTSGSGYSLLNSVPLTNAHFTDNSIIPDQDSYYVVKAVNYANLESNVSTEIIITHPILAPEGFMGKLTDTSAELNWTKHSDPAVKQYNVYRSITPGSNYELLNTLSNEVLTYKDSTALAGIPYYYVITAVSATGVESNKSREVTVMVPQVMYAPTGLTGTLSGTSAILNWTKHSDSAVEQYNIYRTTTSGLNYQLLKTVSNEALTYTDSTIVAGTTYYYVISAISTTDVESIKSTEVIVVLPDPVPASGGNTRRFEETDSSIIYTGTWASGKLSSFSGGIAKTSNVTDSSSELTFTGTGIRWISYLGTNRGKADVYIDGNLISTVDTYSASPKAQKVVFEKLNLSSGSHKIKIVVAGSKHSASTGNYITVDAFEVALPSSNDTTVTMPDSEETSQIVEETDSNIVYTGTWALGKLSSFSAGIAKTSNVTNSSSEFTFTGTGIRWISYLGTNRGKADVYIDDNLISSVDTYSKLPMPKTVAFEKLNLSSGSHKIKIVVAGTRNSASIGNYITVDAFEVVSVLPSNDMIPSAPAYLNGTLSGIATVLNWTLHTDPTVTQYNIYRTTTLGSNYQLLDTVLNPILTYMDSTAIAETTYYYAITAVNTTGRESAKSNEVTVTVPITVPVSEETIQSYEETNSNVVYTGTWASGKLSTFSGGIAKTSNVTNSSSEFTFTGTGIRWISYLTTNRGKANVYIDSDLISTVDTYSASPKPQQVAFEKLDLASGSHTIKIVVDGTRNSASTGNYITVDAFNVVVVLPLNEAIPNIPASAPTALNVSLSSTAAVLNWNLHTDDSVTHYNIYRTTTSGSNYLLLDTVSNPILTYTDSTGIPETTYYYAITAVSSTGEESVKSNEVAVTTADTVPIIEENIQSFEEINSNTVYAGIWASGRLSSFSGGIAKTSNVTNSSSEFTFTGTGIRWISYLTKNRGIASVYIDGTLISAVDTYSALPKAQQVAFEKLDLSSGSHTIKIVVEGTSNSASTGNYITIDAFHVLN